MTQRFLGRVAVDFSLLCLGVSLILALLGKWQDIPGMWVGAFWIFLNFFFLFELIGIGFHVKAGSPKKVLILSIVKFPVLYLVGFAILKSGAFSPMSILGGLTLVMAIFIFEWKRLA